YTPECARCRPIIFILWQAGPKIHPSVYRTPAPLTKSGSDHCGTVGEGVVWNYVGFSFRPSPGWENRRHWASSAFGPATPRRQFA
ncbi:MAG: hypothetical protein LIP77_10670, partial [Planctomycetes bacterium]|nr:hypothetical protein [Planctomycetota bacterium]